MAHVKVNLGGTGGRTLKGRYAHLRVAMRGSNGASLSKLAEHWSKRGHVPHRSAHYEKERLGWVLPEPSSNRLAMRIWTAFTKPVPLGLLALRSPVDPSEMSFWAVGVLF